MTDDGCRLREDDLSDPFFDSVPEVLGHTNPKLALMLVDAFPQLYSSELANLCIDDKYKGLQMRINAYILVGRRGDNFK